MASRKGLSYMDSKWLTAVIGGSAHQHRSGHAHAESRQVPALWRLQCTAFDLDACVAVEVHVHFGCMIGGARQRMAGQSAPEMVEDTAVKQPALNISLVREMIEEVEEALGYLS